MVAGENMWGNIAAQIGGAHVRVTSILSDPNADPHLYESDVASALAVAEAGLVIANGAGYDDFVSQLLGATRNSGRVVALRGAALRFGRHVIWQGLDLDVAPGSAWPSSARTARARPRY